MSNFLQGIFHTPLLVGQNLSQAVCDRICDLAYKFKSDAKSAGLVSEAWNYGRTSSSQEDFERHGVTSFHSGSLLEKPEWSEILSFIKDFADTLISSVNDTRRQAHFLNSWVTIYPPGTYVPEHVHSNSMLSGVFYAKVPEGSGNIIFKDPSAVAKTMFIGDYNQFPTVPTVYTHPVQTGQMIIFPSWLPHLTEVNRSTEDRIMVSFNISMKDV